MGDVLEDVKEGGTIQTISCVGREGFEKRPRTREGAIFTLQSSPELRTHGVRQDYPVQDLETLGGCARGGLDERETSSLAMQRVGEKLDISSNEASANLAKEMDNDGEDVGSGKREESEGQGEPSEGAPERGSGNPEGGGRGRDGAGDDVLDSRQQQQQQQSQKRKDKEGGGSEERGGGAGKGGAITKDSSGNGCSLEGLRVALVRHGISRSRRQVFSRRAAEVGMEARDWPPPQVMMMVPKALLTG